MHSLISFPKTNRSMISIVIPAYNEQNRIERTLEAITKRCKNAEIIVVDDGSKDRTVEITKRFRKVRIIKHAKNMGKGAAVRTGMMEAKGDKILFTDADMSTPITELGRLLKIKADIIIGSRAVTGAIIKLHQPLYRELLGKTFNKIVQLLAVPGVWDTQCGFKIFTNDAAKDIFARTLIDGFGFDVEALYLARQLGYTIQEVPVTWLNSKESKVHPVKDSWRMLNDIFKIKWNALIGRYGI